MQALVTGGAGFIGSHLVERLLSDGHDVRVLDDFSTGERSNLPRHDRLHVISGDVGDLDVVMSAVEGADWVFHKAAVASVAKSISDPLGTMRTNYQGTVNVLEAARYSRVQRVIFAASAAAYGNQSYTCISEDTPLNPMSFYAVHKLASTYTCRIYYQLFGVKTVCLRYFNVYGPRQDPSSPYSGVISIFSDRLAKNEPATIFGDGEQTRDFIYVSDVIDANMKCLVTDGALGHVVNIGTGRPTSINELLRIMCRIKGAPFAPEYAAERHGDIRYSCAAINKAKDTLGWTPNVGLEQGLEMTLATVGKASAAPNRRMI